MKVNCKLLVIVLVSSALLCHVAVDSEEVEDTNNNQSVNPVDPETKGPKNANDTAQNAEQENTGLDTKKEPKEELLREKCDSLSDSCMDDDKTFVACLRVPGNESPALSLLIQNKGKGSRNIIISAPKLVELQKNEIELLENQDTEVKVSINRLESDHFIVLKSGHGNCSLNFFEQYMALNSSSDSAHLRIFKLTLSGGFLVVAVLLTVAVSVFMYTKLGRRYFSRKGPKYQKLDMDLPVTHGRKLRPGENEGWDDSWGENWDDEEAPLTPSMPITPNLSSKGIASRKISKDGWND